VSKKEIFFLQNSQAKLSTSIKFWPILAIIAITIVFHANLFFPEPSIYITPDFARSDALHSNLTSKLLLSQNLKSFQIPLWSNQIGQGFPVLAEGIGGTFYIPNLIIFGLLPLNWAIPIMYITTFLIASLGMYILLRSLRLGAYAQLVGSLSFSFCASMILHVQHYNFIQASSLIPIVAFFTIKIS